MESDVEVVTMKNCDYAVGEIVNVIDSNEVLLGMKLEKHGDDMAYKRYKMY